MLEIPIDTNTLNEETDLCKQLVNKINVYNTLENHSVDQLLAIQQIDFFTNRLIQTPRAVSVVTQKILIDWRASHNFELHLQRFSIHRDASFLLRNYEYAVALQLRNKTDYKSGEPRSIYPVLSELYDFIINYPLDYKPYKEEVVKLGFKLLAVIENDQLLKERLRKEREVLASFYGNMCVIGQANSINHLENYAKKFQRKGGNNQHFFDYENKLVYRVEKRRFQNYDDHLHTIPAAEYFSIDYISTMTEDSEKDVLFPVVLSDYCADGNLVDIAQRTDHVSDDFATLIQVFTQLSDFCLKLIAENFFHSDIKLHNFLFLNNKIVAADRKGIKLGNYSKINYITTTPRFSPAEIRSCFNKDRILDPKKGDQLVAMAPVMAYQLGIALKLFILRSDKVLHIEKIDFSLTNNLSDKTMSNIIMLADALTRQNPSSRLPISTFHKVLPKIKGSPQSLQQALRDYRYDFLNKEKIALQNSSKDTFNDGVQTLARKSYPLDFDTEKVYLEQLTKFSENTNEVEIAKSILELRELMFCIILPYINISQALDHLYPKYLEFMRLKYEHTNVNNELLLKIYDDTVRFMQDNFKEHIDFNELVSLVDECQKINPQYINATKITSFINRFELSDIKLTNKFHKPYLELRNIVITVIKNQISNYLKQKNSVFTEWYSWFTGESNKKLRLNDMQSQPALASIHGILSNLDEGVIRSLFKEDKLLSDLILPLYLKPKKSLQESWEIINASDPSLGSIFLDRVNI